MEITVEFFFVRKTIEKMRNVGFLSQGLQLEVSIWHHTQHDRAYNIFHIDWN